MASTSDGHSSENFPWISLPIDLQIHILLLLPISTLLSCKSVCRHFLAIIRSQSFLSFIRRRRRRKLREDLLLVLASDLGLTSLSAAYHPSTRRWLFFPFPSSISDIYVSGSRLALAAASIAEVVVVDLFSKEITPISPSLGPAGGHWYALALIEDEEAPAADYRIVTVSNGPDAVHSKVYDSRFGRWELKGQLPGVYAMLGNAAFLDGLLFVLSAIPDRLFTFDPASGAWTLVDVPLPPAFTSSHILAFDNKLFFVGGVEVDTTIARIGIWELNRVKLEWRFVGFMPEELLAGFSCRPLQHFLVVHGMGFICFCNVREVAYVMFDLLTLRWWKLPECNLIDNHSWYGRWLALELQPELLSDTDRRLPEVDWNCYLVQNWFSNSDFSTPIDWVLPTLANYITYMQLYTARFSQSSLTS